MDRWMMHQQTQKCIGCGYELRGHSSEGVCPECGRPYGNDLILVGTASPRGSLNWGWVVGTGLLMLGFALLFLLGFWSGIGPFLALVPLLYGIRQLIKTWQTQKAWRKWGGDLRWIVSEDGIRVRRGMRTELNLLEWNAIAKVKPMRAFRFRATRGLKIRRTFLSIDTFRYRSPPIWLGRMTKKDILAIREDVQSRRD